jgi:replicative DNA helicase
MSDDRVPPHSLEAEQSLLGSILIDNDVLETTVRVKRDDFYRGAHRVIFDCISGLVERHVAADLITVTDELRTRGDLDMAGGSGYISSLTSSVVSSSAAGAYEDIVVDRSRIRQLIALAQRVHGMAFDVSSDLDEIMREIDIGLTKIMIDPTRRKTLRYSEQLHALREAIDERSKSSNMGVMSGFAGLDKLLMGLNPTDYAIIGARPSVGKTALALQIAINNTAKNVPVLFWSGEMPAISLTTRAASWGAGIEVSALRSGIMSSADHSRLTQYSGDAYDYPLWINDTPNPDFAIIDRVSRRMAREEGVKIIIIDYLSLIKPRRMSRGTERHEAMAQMSHDLKQLARDTGCVVFVLSQLTRDSDDRKPSLKDLRETGAIEQDADVVILLHLRGSHSGNGELVDAIVAKNRNGPKGVAQMVFDGARTQFRDL